MRRTLDLLWRLLLLVLVGFQLAINRRQIETNANLVRANEALRLRIQQLETRPDVVLSLRRTSLYVR